MAGALKTDTFMGAQAQEHRGLLNIKYPIEVDHQHAILSDSHALDKRCSEF